MGFIRALRRDGQWRLVDPLRDARECPECMAAVYGRQSRRIHRQWHNDQAELQQQMLDVLHLLCAAAGIPTVEPAARPGRDDFDYVDQAEDGHYDDDTGDDEAEEIDGIVIG